MARKITGGKYRKARKKKKYERLGKTTYVTLGKEKRKQVITRGGNIKTILLSADKANVLDKDGKIKVAKIKSVIQVPSNRYLKGVLFKGAIIDTEIGRARITSRPSQDGVVNAVLI
ncbi:MAG: 30S ribosomal protein S8e [Candidatus Pacearchaeota archaeon]